MCIQQSDEPILTSKSHSIACSMLTYWVPETSVLAFIVCIKLMYVRSTMVNHCQQWIHFHAYIERATMWRVCMIMETLHIYNALLCGLLTNCSARNQQP